MMLACLLAVLIMAIVSTSYVPVWMKEIESAHMRDVENAFGNLKSTIDAQIANNNTTAQCSTPIPLGCEGIFLFSPGNMGTLKAEPYTSSVNINNSTDMLNITTTGKIRFISQNRYYTNQEFIYEQSAVIVNQDSGENIIYQPGWAVSNISGYIQISATLVSIHSSNDSITGSGAQSVSTQLGTYMTETYTWAHENITINITSAYASAWYEYFNSLLGKSSLKNLSALPEIGMEKGYVITQRNDGITVGIYGASKLTANYAVINTEI